jgi:uncharacterized membrane protein
MLKTILAISIASVTKGAILSQHDYTPETSTASDVQHAAIHEAETDHLLAKRWYGGGLYGGSSYAASQSYNYGYGGWPYGGYYGNYYNSHAASSYYNYQHAY